MTSIPSPTMPRRTILITGAGSGLGRGLSHCLAKEGHFLLVTDRDFDGAQKTVSLIAEEGGRAEAHRLDVTSETDIARFFGSQTEHTIGVLVNNAGLQQVAPVEDFAIDRWDLLMDVMVRGSFLMTRAILPSMKKEGFGRIIHIGSIHSLVASPYKSAYVAAKHALLGFSKTVALETAGSEITVNTICPSYILTPLVEAQIKDQARTRGIPEEEVITRIMLEPMPKKAFITFEEIAAAISYLVTPLARNITGQTLTIDGGWTAR